jgi:L-threonylcarbamoyladenylate synthase
MSQGRPRPPVVAAGHPGAAERVAEVLLAGGAVVVPTDTVYGLAALPGDRAAVERLFDLKGRPGQVPIAVLCAEAAQALGLAAGLTPGVRNVASRLWPGPLTVVLARRPELDLHLGEPATTVGLRCPDHALIRAIAGRVGPIATTSANRHGAPTPDTALAAAGELAGPVDLVVDGGRLAGAASTVVALEPDGSWRALREGPLTLDEVRAAAEG